VAASQSDEGNNDGAAITPLTSAVIGSDGLAAYPLTADGSGNLAAIWEVVNANPFGIDSLTFSVYLAHSTLNYLNGPYVASLTFSPEPGGGTFSTANASFGLASPVPRFGVYQPQGGTWAQFNLCPLSTNALTVPFSYTPGQSGRRPRPDHIIRGELAVGIAQRKQPDRVGESDRAERSGNAICGNRKAIGSRLY
jgi:hypothetical protein